MPFTISERSQMLALKGVGPTVIQRLEQIGYHSLHDLQNQRADDVTKQVSDFLGSTCWHNSPMARASIQAIISLAESQ